MKYIPSNIEIMNKKYSSNKQQTVIIKDAIDDDLNIIRDNSETKKEYISEIDLKNEVYRLQNILKKMNDDFAFQRKK